MDRARYRAYTQWVIIIKRVLVNLTSLQIEELDEMVKEGKYSNRAKAVRDAVRILLEKKKIEELHKVL